MPLHHIPTVPSQSEAVWRVRLPAMVLSVLFLWSIPALSQTPPGDCPGQPNVIEGESCSQELNPGCLSSAPTFTSVACGDLVCANSWASGGMRDVDWYRFLIDDLDGSGKDQVRISVRSSIPLISRLRLGCGDPPVNITDSQFDPLTGEWSLDIEVCVMANMEVLMQLEPGFKASGPILEGYPCNNTGYPYSFLIECNPDCDETLCPVCVQSPEGLVAWWMLDENSNASYAGEVVLNHNASYFGGLQSGVPGAVDSGVNLNGAGSYLQVEDTPQLNFESGDDFTLMAWIKIDGGVGTRVLFSKLTAVPPYRGWGFGLNDDNQLIMTLADEGGVQVFNSTAFVPEDRWAHVAVSIDRDQPDGLQFHINGEPAGVADPTSNQLDLNNDRPLYLGCAEVPSGLTRFFPGGLDEVMIVDYPLASNEILRIAKARCGGVCKQRMHVTRFTPICDGQTEVSAIVTIMNDRPTPAAYEINFDGLPANGADCTIDGPVEFMMDIQNPIVVGPLSRQEFKVLISKPNGMFEDGDTGCWRAFIQESTQIQPIETRRGYVIQSDRICVEPLGIPQGIQGLPLDTVTPVEFVVHNLGDTTYDLIYKIFAVDSITGMPNPLLRLNNQEPGAGIVGMITIPPSASQLVFVESQWTFTRADTEESTKGKITDFVMYEDPGKIEPDTGIGSKGTEATERSQSVCDSEDLDCDGVVDVDDLLELLSQYGECPDPTDCRGDLDQDGDVDVDDLLTLLAAYTTS